MLRDISMEFRAVRLLTGLSQDFYVIFLKSCKFPVNSRGIPVKTEGGLLRGAGFKNVTPEPFSVLNGFLTIDVVLEFNNKLEGHVDVTCKQPLNWKYTFFFPQRVT